MAKRSTRAWVVAALITLALASCGPASPTKTAAQKASAASSGASKSSAETELRRAEQLFLASQYEAAEALFRPWTTAARGSSSSVRERATLGLARVELATGRAEEAARRVEPLADSADAALIFAMALRSQGKPFEARKRLEEALVKLTLPQGSRLDLDLLLGEILLEVGEVEAATARLMMLVEAYNADHIASGNAEALAAVGRAAHLLRSAPDANDAFNEAEMSGPSSLRTLLWRAELYLEKYDAGHAEEVLRELLQAAPDHAEALVAMAKVKLAQTLDFDAADRLAERALSVNPKLARAYFILAGTALRDMEIARAEEHLRAGLECNPRDLELLSLRAAARFLADDRAGFEEAIERVLALNPHFSRVYQIVGEYAEWEHRYDEIVQMMTRALVVDPEDAVARAELGMNLLRSGAEARGVVELEQAFTRDRFNVRVFNTLNLYQETIAKDYVSVPSARFLFRYPNSERPILERYVPDLVERALTRLQARYGFTPELPIGVELYRKREHFAVRTSGLPGTPIQGVCFGKVLAAMSVGEEQFNLGMTLWHEVAHVFHIQLSKSHVPRWFTEGLAEYETLLERPEWAREQDLELYDALRRGRIPHLDAMNRAFTRAEDLKDVAMAYYVSTKAVAWMAERYGFPKLIMMLKLWGEGKTTPVVLETALGAPVKELDGAFRKHLDQELARYGKQFVPELHVPDLGLAKAEAQSRPSDAKAQRRLALSFLEARRLDAALGVLGRARKLDPKHPDLGFLEAKMEMARERPVPALASLLKLVQGKHDGYLVQLLLAQAFRALGQNSDALAALTRAAELDPSQSEPLYGLLRGAREAGDKTRELQYLRRVAELDEHAVGVYRRLLDRLIEGGAFADAVRVGESAVHADVAGLQTHLLFAQALEASGQGKRALYEFESATHCPASPAEKTDAYRRLGEAHKKRGNAEKARRALESAKGALQGT